MNPLAVALVAILSLVASCVHGRAVPDATSDDEAAAAASVVVRRQCRHASDGFTRRQLYQTLADGQRACMGDPADVVRRLMTEAKTGDEILAVMHEVCAATPEFRRCLSEVTEDAGPCIEAAAADDADADDDATFELLLNVRDFVEAVVTTTCSNRSEGVAVLMYAWASLRGERTTVAEDCVAALEGFMNCTHLGTGFSHVRYRTIRGLKTCVVDVIRDDDRPDVVGVVGHFFDDVLAKMTCISVETAEVGLCERMHLDDMNVTQFPAVD